MEQRPSFVLVMSDQQRFDSLGCYGNRFVVSPNLDRLAGEGAMFRHCFTPWPVCTPARATTWTGLYPHAHGVIDNVYGIDDALQSVARNPVNLFDLLKQQGYATAYFGKWHLGNKNPGAFDVWEAFNSLGSHWVDSRIDGSYKPDVQTDQCIAYLKSIAEQDRPFVIVQSYYPPHDPFTAPRRFYEPYRGKGVPFAGYYAAVSNIDYNVGRLVQTLEELKLSERTIFVFFSDHGETFKYRDDGEHKFVCFDDAIRIPFIVRWPAHVPPGRVLDPVIGLQDLMPTVLDYAGAPMPHGLHGRSIRPWLQGETVPWRDTYYAENRTWVNRYPQRCIRAENWKLILSDGGPHSLYNLRDDPEEELDVFETPRADVYDQYLRFPSFTSEIADLAANLRRQALDLGDDLGVTLADRVLNRDVT